MLGPVEARLPDGGPVAVGGPQVRSLLAMLLLEAGRAVSVGRLAAGLYGEDAHADVAHALQSQVSRLRRGLRDGAAVEFGSAGYRLAVGLDTVDAHRFARLAGQGRQALAGGDPAAAAVLLGEALDLWRGPALADVLDAPFAEAAAARLLEERLAAVEDRAEAALALGEHHAVAAELAELVEAHPLRERARALLMRALYAGGRQAEALTVFEEARRFLGDELGVDPSAELAEAHLSILRAEPAATPALRRVPAQLTSFVGRAEELRRLATLPAGSRLVTLTGPGGTGKTRLAVEASGRMSGEVCFVDLAPLSDGAQVAPAVAAALGLRESGPPEDRLVAALADRPVLVILDNCEHVVTGAAGLAHRLLAACPALRILATSREALGITGEVLFPVGQLAVPGPDATLAEALAGPAVRLFADRAAAVRHGFVVDAATIGAVRRICAALDGLPLAIELAAARLRSFTLEEVDARLADRFRLLSRGERTAAPRHQTLRAVVDWSWGLLDAREQALARRLTVFAGGATLTDAEQVCGLAGPVGYDDVAGVLAGLVDKSLVEAHDGRYRMLETVREYCAERLAETGERAECLRAHAECFTALAEAADHHLRGPDQLNWLARLGAEHGNLLAALGWAVTADPPLASRLLAALSWFWWLRGLRGEAAPLAAQLLGELGDGSPAEVAEVAQVAQATEVTKWAERTERTERTEVAEEYACCVVTAAATGNGSDAGLRDHLDRAAAGLAAYDRPLRRPHVVFLLAMAGRLVDVAPARQHRLFDTDPWSQAFLHMGDGLRLLLGGQTSAAEAELTTALAGFRSTGDRWAIANALDKLAGIAASRGERARSVAWMDEAIMLIEELGRTEDTADLLTRRADLLAEGADLSAEGSRLPAEGSGLPAEGSGLPAESGGLAAESGGLAAESGGLAAESGGLAAESGGLAAARAGYERAAEVARAVGAPDLLADARRGLADLARRSGESGTARQLYEAALADCGDASITGQRIRARILTGLGWTATMDRDAAQARAHHRAALETAVRGGNLPAAADAVDGLAGAALLTGDAERAATLVGAAASLRGVELTADHEAASSTEVAEVAGAAEVAEVARAAAMAEVARAEAAGAEAAGMAVVAGVAVVAAAAERALGSDRYVEARRRGRGMTAEEVLGLAG
ncbi:BTAD domain-containing putative transcriptional regulator [Nonomuraea sp. NPDC049269]|uniref:BTAD domain-containing putative transcriptional regulator n=1 Tax=Nonomuraea sp. NPDC049269 TaxID=3364349 RepID=UPI00371BA6CC